MSPDGMQPWALREIAEIILRPFSIIFDPSGRLGEAPEDLRKPNVTAIFKKGKKEDPGSYRLVILTELYKGVVAANLENNFQVQ